MNTSSLLKSTVVSLAALVVIASQALTGCAAPVSENASEADVASDSADLEVDALVEKKAEAVSPREDDIVRFAPGRVTVIERGHSVIEKVRIKDIAEVPTGIVPKLDELDPCVARSEFNCEKNTACTLVPKGLEGGTVLFQCVAK
jgi:hypothetical protein